MSTTPDPWPGFLSVGHVTQDYAGNSWRLGGAAAYAARVAVRLGLPTALLTAAGCALNLGLGSLLPGIEIYCTASEQTTAFTHLYESGRRIQYVRSRAAPIRSTAVPSALREAKLVLLGSICGDVDPWLAAAFPTALMGATAQGWLRRLGEDGLVSDGHIEDLQLAAIAGRLDALFLSDEDLGGASLPAAWLAAIPIIAVTQGRFGARLWAERRWWQIPAFPATVLDATGAGDAFAAGFLISYGETGDAAMAARFAAAVASFIVEAAGISGAPSRFAVEERLQHHPQIQLSKE